LIVCRSSDEYIDIIERYLDSSEDRNKIATKGREFVVKNFSWNVIQDKFKKLILE
jgi:spore maturation protein CgeB